MKLTHVRTRTWLLPLVAALIGAVAAMGADRTVFAQQTGIKRTILLRTDDPGSATYEAVMGIAEIAPGANAGKHRHHGVELGYVLDGPVVLQPEGRPAITLKTGESFKNEGVHDAMNPGKKPAKILAIYIVEKGKPLAEPAK
jgi:quercetin dioxygenase-like cupin family protein